MSSRRCTDGCNAAACSNLLHLGVIWIGLIQLTHGLTLNVVMPMRFGRHPQISSLRENSEGRAPLRRVRGSDDENWIVRVMEETIAAELLEPCCSKKCALNHLVVGKVREQRLRNHERTPEERRAYLRLRVRSMVVPGTENEVSALSCMKQNASTSTLNINLNS